MGLMKEEKSQKSAMLLSECFAEFKILRHTHSIQYSPKKIVQIFNIICAMNNHLLKPLYSKKNLLRMNKDCKFIMSRMKVRNNIHQKEAKVGKNWTQRDALSHIKTFVPRYALQHLCDFPM